MIESRISIDLAERLRIARFLTRIERLIALDAISTSILESGRELGGEELERLREIISEMRQWFSFCAREVAWLSGVILRLRQEFDSMFLRAIEDSVVSEKIKVQLRRAVNEGKLVELIRQASIELPVRAVRESDNLSRQLEAASRRQPTTGDLPRETLCMLEGAGVGACVLLGAWGPAIGIGLKMAGDCL